MKKQPDISVVIVNHNTNNDLKNCLFSLYKYSQGINFETIVIDNASTDGSPKMVKNFFPQVKLITNRKNNYFSSGYNQGLKTATGKYLLILAPDTIITQQTLRIMYSFMEKYPRCGLAGCRQTDENNILNPTGCRYSTPLTEILDMPLFSRFSKNSFLLKRMRLSSWDRRDIRQVDTIPGSFMFGRCDVLKKVGFMDEKFQLYFSDQDLSKKIKDSGWLVYHYGTTSIIHLRAQTTKKIPLYQIMQIAYRDMLYYYRKHFSLFWQPILYFFSRLNLIYFMSVYYLKKLKNQQ